MAANGQGQAEQAQGLTCTAASTVERARVATAYSATLAYSISMPPYAGVWPSAAQGAGLAASSRPGWGRMGL